MSEEEGEREKRPNNNNNNDVPPTHISLKITSQTKGSVNYMVKRNVQLKKLLEKYCERLGVDDDTYVFLYEGQRIKGHHTPEKFEMEDGDEIDAMLHQGGGGGAAAAAGLLI